MKRKTSIKKFNPSEDLTLTRWQVSLFEICMLAWWALFTIYLPEFFISIERILWVLFVSTWVYVCYIHFKQTNK